MMMINSSTLDLDSNKHRYYSMKPFEENFDDINNNNHYEKEKNPLIKQDILSSNHTDLLTKTMTSTTTTTVEVKVKTNKTSTRKRKLNILNDNINQQQQTIHKKKKQQQQRVTTKIDNDDHKKKKTNHIKTVDQSSITDESSFGSCEPGTNVILQGIVWNETDKGVLVVNITWRGKTYVGALLNTTEQNWAPPRYKSDVRSIKANPNRDHQLNSMISSSSSSISSSSSSHEPSERILRNGKRRGSNTTVTPNSTTKTKAFKIPGTPSLSVTADETLILNEKHILPLSTRINNQDEINIQNEIGDNESNRSISPVTSGLSTTSSNSPLSNNNENQSTIIPMDLSHAKPLINIEDNTSKIKTNDTVIPYHHFNNERLLSSAAAQLPISSQIYFNSLTTSSPSSSSHYPALTYLSNSS